MTFGKKFREDKFLFPKDATPINHGSYGAVPKRVYETYKKWLHKDFQFPDEFMHFFQAQEMEKSLKVVSKLVNTDYKNLAFVPNATSGVNVVFRSFPFQKGDTIVISSVIYDACGNTIDFAARRNGVNLKIVDITFPMSEKTVLSRFEATFKQVLETKKTGSQVVCIYDAICSMPGCRMPFERITELCRKYGIVSCIDGAHSIGMIPIDIQAIGCDFYTSNLHKWLYLPRGCAILYVTPKFHDAIMPFPISHSYKDQEFYKRFLFTASNNYSSFYCIPEALKFVNEDCGGFDKIRSYCRKQGNGIIAHFGTDHLVSVTEPSADDLNFMVTVKVDLPKDKQEFFARSFKNKQFENEVRDFVLSDLLRKSRTFVQFGWHNNFLFVRFSCQIYTDLQEYFWGYDQFLKELDRFYASDLFQKWNNRSACTSRCCKL